MGYFGRVLAEVSAALGRQVPMSPTVDHALVDGSVRPRAKSRFSWGGGREVSGARRGAWERCGRPCRRFPNRAASYDGNPRDFRGGSLCFRVLRPIASLVMMNTWCRGGVKSLLSGIGVPGLFALPMDQLTGKTLSTAIFLPSTGKLYTL